MRRIGRLFGKNTNRKSGRTQNRNAKHWPQFTPTLEMLEARQLLSVNPVTPLEFGSDDVVDGTQMQFTVSGGSGSSVLGLRVSSPDGSMNPAAPWIENANGISIAPIYAVHNMPGSSDSLLLAELGPGTYTVTINTEGGTAGQCRLDVFLPGDVNDDGMVSSQEYTQACAASVQNDGYWNSFTARYYSSLGFNLNTNWYDQDLDVNSDGHINSFDTSYIYPNVGMPKITGVAIDTDITGPDLQVGLETDSGLYNNDFITNQFAIKGQIKDLDELTALTLSIDAHSVDDDGVVVDILADVAADGSFLLSQERLEELYGSDILDDDYTLTFAASDDSDNDSIVVVSFTLDTVAPDKPTAPDLTEDSDSGYLNDDNITNVNTPVFELDFEIGDYVTLSTDRYYDDEPTTHVIAEGELSDTLVTSSKLSDGKNIITYTITDLAGNVSEASDELEMIVDTYNPAVVDLDLAADSDTGEAGDKITSETIVKLEGQSELEYYGQTYDATSIKFDQSIVKLKITLPDGTTRDVDADADGKFVFDNIDLDWNTNDFVVYAEDAAGNVAESDFEVTFIQNNAPEVIGSIDRTIDEQYLPYEIHITDADSELFGDIDIDDTLTITLISNTNPDLLTATLEKNESDPAPEGYAYNYVLKLTMVEGYVFDEDTNEAKIFLSATDEVGQNASTLGIFTITVSDMPDDPIAVADTAETAENVSINIDVTANDYDPDDDPQNPGVITIDSFDATSEKGATITQNTDGTLKYDPTASYDLNALAEGETIEDTFSYTITDENGGTATGTVTITVTGVNDAPIAVDDDDNQVDEDMTLEIDVLANDVDSDTNDTLTVTEVRSEAEGVGKSEKGATVTIQSDGTVLYDPTGVEGLSDLDHGQTVTDTFKYTISDEYGGTDTGTVTVVITGTNDAPQYDGELEYVDEDTQFTIDLREHFSDEETDDDALIFTMVDDGNNCTAQLQADGHTVVIDPDANFNGMAFFQVKASDGNTTDSQETEARPILIFVRPINDKPVAVDDTTTVDADQTVTIDVLNNDTDDDQDDTLSLDENDVVLSTGFEGTVTLVDGKFVFDPTGSDALKQLKDGEQIAQTFTYTVQDDAEPTHTSDTATVTITITGVNDAPEQIVSGLSTDEDTPKVIDLRTLISDAEAPTADFTGYVFTIDGVSNGSYDFDGDHTVTFTPDENYYGNEASIVFSVTDTANNDANKHTVQMTLPITVNSVNDLPAAEKALALDIEEDTTQDIDLRDYISDVETADEALIFFDVKDPLHGSAELLEDGHTVRFSPESEYQGPAEFKFSVEDADGASVEMTFTIEVTPVNDAPKLEDGSQLVIDEENVLHVDLRTLVSDDETADDDLFFDAIAATNGTAVMDSDGFTLHFTPGDISNGLGSFTFRVTDTGLGTADPKFSEFTINVEITPFNDTPEAEDTEVVVVAEDGSVVVDLRDRVQDVETADDDLVFSVNDSQSQHGTVVMIDDYQARFTPDGDYKGPASFEFSVTDTGDGTAAAKTVDMTVDVSVQPENDSPVLDSDEPISVDEDVVLEFDLRTRVSDLETADDDLIFEITGYTGGTAVLDTVDGHTVYFTPDADYTGPASFTFTVTDTGEGTPPHDADPITETFTLDVAITPINDPPVLDDDTPETTNEDTPVSIDLYDHVRDNFTPDEGLIFEIIGYTDGTAVMDDNEHVVHFTPGTNFVGTASLEFKVTDGGEGDDGPLSETFTLDIIVDPVNDAPQAEGSTTVSATEDTPIILDLRTKVSDLETDNDDLIFTLEHPDTPGGPTATITKEQGTFTLIENPNGNDYQVEFTPAADFYGAVNFSFWVTDTGEGTSDAISKNFLLVFDVAPVPDAPVAIDETVDAAPDATTTIDVLSNCSDVDPDDVLSIVPGSLTPQAGFEGSISIVDNKIVFDPAGSQAIAELKDGEELPPQTFTYTVQDSANPALTDTATVTLTITGVNDAPQQVVTEIITNEDVPVIIDLWDLISDAETPSNIFTDYEFDIIAVSCGSHEFINDHKITFTPSANYHGYEASITFSVTDTAVDDANKQTKDFIVPITITAMNDVPVPEDTSVIDVDEDGSVQINLRTRVDDVETDDADLAFSASNPQGGTLSWINDYTVEFTPTAGYNGPASFDFEVTDTGDGDGTGAGTPAKRGFQVALNVIAINDAPIIDPNAPAIDADEDVTIDINLDDHIYDYETLDADLVFNNISATGGEAVLDGHIVHFTPTADYAGAASITVDVTDKGDNGADAITETLTINFSIDSTPDAPVAEDDTAAGNADVTTEIDVLNNDDDADPDDVLSIEPGSLVPQAGFEGSLSIVDNKIVFDPTGSQAIAELKDGEDLVQTFTYTVQDSANPALTDTATVTLTVTGVNDAPVQVASDITTAEDTLKVIDLWSLISDAETPSNDFTDFEFTVTGVSDGTFDFDGDRWVTFTPSQNYNGSEASITFSVTDTAVTDTNKQTVNDIEVPITVTAVNDTPVAEATDTIDVAEDGSVQIDLRLRVADVETTNDDDLTFSASNPQGGTLAWINDYIVEFTPTADYNGPASFEFEVLDTGDGDGTGAGAPATEGFTVNLNVTPVNDAPVVDPAAPAIDGDEDTTWDINLREQFADHETLDADLIFNNVSATNGTAVLDGHIIHFTPTADYAGPASINVDVTDTGDDPAAAITKTFTLNFTVENTQDAPVAVDDDNVDVPADAVFTINVLANDTDADAGQTETLTIVDSIVPEAGFQGTLTIVDNKIEFDPSGIDTFSQLLDGDEITQTFTYEVRDTDGNVSTATATVTVNVIGVNDAPEALTVSAVTTPEETPVTFDLWDYFSDAEAPDGNFDGYTFEITGASNGSAVYNQVDHTVTFTPADDHNGPATVKFKVTDIANTLGNEQTTEITVDIDVTPLNDDPVANNDPLSGSTEVSDDQDTVLDVLENDDDVDGDDLIITAVDTTGLDGQVTIAADSKSLIYTPSGSYNGPETFTYTISDGNGGTDTATVTLNVVGNQTPVPVNDVYNVTEDAVLNENVLDNDDDPDTGDTLTVINVTFVSGNLANFPPTVASDGSFSYDPIAIYQTLSVGETVQGIFEYTVQDNTGATATAQVTITVTGVNDLPSAGAITDATNADTAITDGSLISSVNETDANDTLIYGLASATSAKGAAVTVNPSTGAWTYDPSGAAELIALGMNDDPVQDTFTYTVDDQHGGTTQNTITITVTGVNDAPVAEDFSDGVNANATTGGELSDHVNDPDTTDSLQYTLTGAAPLGNVQIDLDTGAWTYDPSGVADFVALAAGVTAQDTFTYTVSDGNGGYDTKSVTITVTGVNDAPTAYNDSDNTLNNSTVDIDLLYNDTDPDNGDTLTIISIDTTGTGGTVTDNGDGTVTYDPSGWAAAQALAPAQQIQDTFTYTISDGNETSQATVTVTVTGTSASTDPQVVNPIADLTINDTESQPITYNLSTVFSDDGPLSYQATSSNEDLVQVNITGSTLSITYASYESSMDRSPAKITVTATETGGAHNSASHYFYVTVVPETTVDVQFVVRDTATPVGETSTSTLPESITSVGVGQNYVVEIWMKDLLDNTVTSGPVSTGLIGGMFDISFDNSIGQGVSLHHEGAFTFEPSGNLNTPGLVDNFHGGTLDAGNGINGNYVRLGYVTFQATASGDQTFSLSYEDLSRESNEIGGTEVVTGTVDESQVSLPSVTVSQQEAVTLSVHSLSNVKFSGISFGKELKEQESTSDSTHLSGSIEAIVTYDIHGDPSSIKFVDANIVADNLFQMNMSPGINGVVGTAEANAGLSNLTGTTDYAIRDMVISLATDQPIQNEGAQLIQDTIDFTVSQGGMDYRSGDIGKRIDLSAHSLSEIDSDMGSLYKSDNRLVLTLNFKRSIDISGDTGVTGDVLTLNGNIHAELVLTNLTAAEMSQTVAAADETNLVMTLSKSATALDDNGQVNTLPISEGWIDEWDSYWVEIWARTGEGSGINAANLNLNYNGNYFTAVEVQHGPGLNENTSADISVDGIVSGLSGSAATDGLGTDGFVMVGRVKFESLDGDQVPIDSLNRVIGPHDLGLEISNAAIDVEGVDESHIIMGAAPETELWAVPYDVNDNDRVDLGDLAFFAKSYQTDVLESDASFVWASDYDKSGDIDLGDLSFFASNYRKAKDGDSDIAYPASFLQRWIGTGIEATGDSAIHEVLEAAVETWQHKLDLDEPIDIQLVVKDFGTSQLGEGQILAVDENGRPISGRITLDDDAAGIGWYSQLEGAPAEGKYDLYTVLLHEVGHTLGFMQQYDGFAENVESDGEDGLLFVGAGLDAELDAAGQHLSAVAHPGDLMNSTLSPGIRRLPSDLSAQMILTAYDSATVGGGGFAAIGAAMNAEIAQPVTLTANTASTTDFSRVEGRLEGDVTWDRMFSGHDDRLNPSDAESVDQAVLDTVIDDISQADFNCDIPEVGEHIRLDAAGFAMHSHEDMSIDRPTAKKANGKNIFDAVFGDWDQPLG